MRPKYHDIFCQALMRATESTDAWVTTGGTNAGVMKLGPRPGEGVRACGRQRVRQRAAALVLPGHRLDPRPLPMPRSAPP